MEQLESINYLDLCAIPDLCNKNFYIPDYQRGYRWGSVQIRQLLEDLYGFFYDGKVSGSFYCLQPIVVKEMPASDVESMGLFSTEDSNRWYEVIDGQQRLTTILIILTLESLLDEDKELRFTIYYKTRPNLGELFGHLVKVRDENKRYSIHVEKEAGLDIDSWHILRAANEIISWFQSETNTYNPSISSFKGTFYEKFSNTKDKNKSVQVIWYEIRDDSDAYDMFKRLNDKSIYLNNAELIRGLFLSDSAKYKNHKQLLSQFNEDVRDIVAKREQDRKQSHIIEQWDIIESQLRNEKFWAFIKQDKSSENYSCRIEYLFDMVSKKSPNQKDRLYTYLEFEDMLKDSRVEDLWDLWIKVETYYSLLMAWFKDSYYYHKIGFLTTVLGTDVLIELLDESAHKSKTEFKKIIDRKILLAIHDSRKSDRKILEYNYQEDATMLKRVLFLYNVESTFQQGLEFFPFDEYKNHDWTLEHIHAQNSELIDQSQKNKWEEWFAENKKTLECLHVRLPDDQSLANLLKHLNSEYQKLKNNREKYTFSDLTLVFDRVLKYFNDLSSQEGTPTVMHGISNMALLSGAVNTSIGNSVFEVKRQMIMNADAQGEYIPLCTRKVFLKYYNSKNPNFTVQQNFYWSEKDRVNYLEDIKKVLKSYIDAESILKN